MKAAREFVTNTVIGGVFIVVPVYLAILLLLKGMQSAVRLVRPFAALLPDWLPAEGFFSFLLVLLVCFVVGAAVRTRGGRALRERLEKVFFERLPGYSLLRSLTQRLAGDSEESAWQPALVEIEDALVPGFIIEELEDGRFTVFVPSVPTPLARGGLDPRAGTRASSRHPLHTGGQVDLTMGLGVERARRLDARRLTRTRQARRCSCRGRRAARTDRSARQRPATWGRTLNSSEHEGSAR